MSARFCPRCGCDVVAETEARTRVEGPALRREREARGLSLREVARRLNISPTHLSNVERGRQAPSSLLRNRLMGEIATAASRGER